MKDEEQVELFSKELTELSDFNYLARKSLVRMEEAVDDLQKVVLLLKNFDSKLDTLLAQTVKTELIEDES